MPVVEKSWQRCRDNSRAECPVAKLFSMLAVGLHATHREARSIVASTLLFVLFFQIFYTNTSTIVVNASSLCERSFLITSIRLSRNSFVRYSIN